MVRMHETSRRAAAFVEREPGNEAKGAALQLLASTPYFVHAQSQLDSRRRQMSHKEARPLVDYACRTNALMVNYMLTDPDAHPNDILEAMMATEDKFGNSNLRQPDLRKMLTSTIHGMQHEAISPAVIANLGQIRPATHDEDMSGVDMVLQDPKNLAWGVPIDIKASEMSVGKKCQTPPAKWGFSNEGTLVLASHLPEIILKDKCTIDDQTARQIYELSGIKQALADGLESQYVRRERW